MKIRKRSIFYYFLLFLPFGNGLITVYLFCIQLPEVIFKVRKARFDPFSQHSRYYSVVIRLCPILLHHVASLALILVILMLPSNINGVEPL